jgi:hypothetical protein
MEVILEVIFKKQEVILEDFGSYFRVNGSNIRDKKR